MNNKVPTLDPKMKAIYDQVMSTVVAPPTPAAPLSQSPLNPPLPATPTLPISAPTPTIPADFSRPTLVTEQVPTTLGRPEIPVQKGLYGTLSQPTPTAPLAPKSKATSYIASPTIDEKPKNSSPLMPIIFALSGLIFFVVYVIFWAKFFNLNLPFLPV